MRAIYNLCVAHIYELSTMLLKYFCKNFSPIHVFSFYLDNDATLTNNNAYDYWIFSCVFSIFLLFFYLVSRLTLVLHLSYCVAVIITIITTIAIIDTINIIIIIIITIPPLLPPLHDTGTIIFANFTLIEYYIFNFIKTLCPIRSNFCLHQ